MACSVAVLGEWLNEGNKRAKLRVLRKLAPVVDDAADGREASLVWKRTGVPKLHRRKKQADGVQVERYEDSITAGDHVVALGRDVPITGDWKEEMAAHVAKVERLVTYVWDKNQRRTDWTRYDDGGLRTPSRT